MGLIREISRRGSADVKVSRMVNLNVEVGSDAASMIDCDTDEEVLRCRVCKRLLENSECHQ